MTASVYGVGEYHVGAIAAVFAHSFIVRPAELVDTVICRHRRPNTHEPHVITVCPRDGIYIHWYQEKA